MVVYGGSTYGDGPWEGAIKWARVPDRDDIGQVIQGGTNIGRVYCLALRFPSGLVAYYDNATCIRCDESGNTTEPS